MDAPWAWWKHRADHHVQEYIDDPVFAIYLPDSLRDIDQPIRDQIRWCIDKNVRYMGLEGGRLVSVQHLPELAEIGVRYVTLMHNFDNEIGGSATDTGTAGISQRGIELVQEMCKVGIYPDISHANERTAKDIIGYSDGPVLATHSGCRALVDHPRNLRDEQIRMVANTGGVVGVPFVRKFVGDALTSIADHVDHITQLVGIRHVAIGSDIDGARTVVEAPRWREVVEGELRHRGYSEADIEAVSGGNALRLLDPQ